LREDGGRVHVYAALLTATITTIAGVLLVEPEKYMKDYANWVSAVLMLAHGVHVRLLYGYLTYALTAVTPEDRWQPGSSLPPSLRPLTVHNILPHIHHALHSSRTSPTGGGVGHSRRDGRETLALTVTVAVATWIYSNSYLNLEPYGYGNWVRQVSMSIGIFALFYTEHTLLARNNPFTARHGFDTKLFITFLALASLSPTVFSLTSLLAILIVAVHLAAHAHPPKGLRQAIAGAARFTAIYILVPALVNYKPYSNIIYNLAFNKMPPQLNTIAAEVKACTLPANIAVGRLITQYTLYIHRTITGSPAFLSLFYLLALTAAYHTLKARRISLALGIAGALTWSLLQNMKCLRYYMPIQTTARIIFTYYLLGAIIAAKLLAKTLGKPGRESMSRIGRKSLPLTLTALALTNMVLAPIILLANNPPAINNYLLGENRLNKAFKWYSKLCVRSEKDTDSYTFLNNHTPKDSLIISLDTCGWLTALSMRTQQRVSILEYPYYLSSIGPRGAALERASLFALTGTYTEEDGYTAIAEVEKGSVDSVFMLNLGEYLPLLAVMREGSRVEAGNTSFSLDELEKHVQANTTSLIAEYHPRNPEKTPVLTKTSHLANSTILLTFSTRNPHAPAAHTDKNNTNITLTLTLLVNPDMEAYPHKATQNTIILNLSSYILREPITLKLETTNATLNYKLTGNKLTLNISTKENNIKLAIKPLTMFPALKRGNTNTFHSPKLLLEILNTTAKRELYVYLRKPHYWEFYYHLINEHLSHNKLFEKIYQDDDIIIYQAKLDHQENQ